MFPIRWFWLRKKTTRKTRGYFLHLLSRWWALNFLMTNPGIPVLSFQIQLPGLSHVLGLFIYYESNGNIFTCTVWDFGKTMKRWLSPTVPVTVGNPRSPEPPGKPDGVQAQGNREQIADKYREIDVIILNEFWYWRNFSPVAVSW